MAINLYSVRNHLEEEGWQLISTEYKNLDTELTMICPKGHTQLQTYKQWRKRPLCEICLAGDPFKVQKNNVPDKQENTYRVLALDAATHVSGYSIYDDDTLVSYGIYKTNASKSTVERIHDIKLWLLAAIDAWKPDFVGIEHIQLQKYELQNTPQVELYRVLANLQGVLLDTLFSAAIDYDLAYSTQWREYCGVMGKGREEKKIAAQAKVKQWYKIECSQDEADAICIGKYFTHLLKSTSNGGWGEAIQ